MPSKQSFYTTMADNRTPQPCANLQGSIICSMVKGLSMTAVMPIYIDFRIRCIYFDKWLLLTRQCCVVKFIRTGLSSNWTLLPIFVITVTLLKWTVSYSLECAAKRFIHWQWWWMKGLSIDDLNVTLISRLIGSTWDPPGTDRTQLGPVLAPWTLLPRYLVVRCTSNITYLTFS